MEHRWGQRFPVDVEVRLPCSDGAQGEGILRDVSVSGGFIEAGLSLKPYDSVEIEIGHTSATARPASRVTGWVVRTTAYGVGVEWTILAPPAIRTLMTAHELEDKSPLRQAPAPDLWVPAD